MQYSCSFTVRLCSGNEAGVGSNGWCIGICEQHIGTYHIDMHTSWQPLSIYQVWAFSLDKSVFVGIPAIRTTTPLLKRQFKVGSKSHIIDNSSLNTTYRYSRPSQPANYGMIGNSIHKEDVSLKYGLSCIVQPVTGMEKNITIEVDSCMANLHMTQMTSPHL